MVQTWLHAGRVMFLRKLENTSVALQLKFYDGSRIVG